MATGAKQFALLVFSMTFHARHIIGIMHVVMGVLPFFVLRAGCSLYQLISIVAVETGKVGRKRCWCTILMAHITGVSIIEISMVTPAFFFSELPQGFSSKACTCSK